MQGIQTSSLAATGMNFEPAFFQQPETRPVEPPPPLPAFNVWRPATWPTLCRARREIPVYFDPAQYRDIAAFQRSREFTRFRFQFSRAIDDIQMFYATHSRGNDLVEQHLNIFRQHLFNGYFADHMPLLYTEGKKLVERIQVALRSDALPVERRVDIVRAMALGLTECSGGTMSNLQDAVSSLTDREDSLVAFALTVKHEMADAAMLDFIKSHHAYAVGNEIHYVNAYRDALDQIWGLRPRADPFMQVVTLSGEDILGCNNQVALTVTPQRLLDFLTDSFMQDMQALFQYSFRGCKMPMPLDRASGNVDRYQNYMEKLDAYDKTRGKRFGGLPPLDAFLALDDAGNLLGFKPQSMLVKHEFLHRLRQSGLIADPADAEIVGKLPDGAQLLHLADPSLIWLDTPTGPQMVTPACLAGLAAAAIRPRLRELLLQEAMPCEPAETLLDISPEWFNDLADDKLRIAFFKRLEPGLLCDYVNRHSPLPAHFCDALFKHAVSGNTQSSRDLLLALLDGGNPVTQQQMLMKALHKAIIGNDFEAVGKIVRAGAEIDSPGRLPPGHTPLISAIMHGKLEMVAKLIELGARIDAPSVFHACPIEYAISCSRTDILRLLLEKASAEHLRQKCAYADTMILNCDDDSEAKAALLLEHLPLDYVAVDEDNNTFLMKILRNLPTPRLLRAIANHPLVQPSLNVKNRAGETVLDIALRSRLNTRQAEVLREAGALPGKMV